MRRVQFRLGLALVLAAALISAFSAFYTPYDPYEMNQAARYEAPSMTHVFGTDNFGRDILSRVLSGCGISLGIAAAALAAALAAGCALGLCAAVGGRYIDSVIMLAVNALNSIPAVLAALVLRSVLPDGNSSLILTMAAVFAPVFVRVVRNETALVRELEYVQHARIQGAGTARIVFVHILPNIRGPLVSAAVIVMTRVLLIESTLSYLGVGVQPPLPSLGRMMFDAQSYLFTAPWAALFPGIALVLIIVSFNYLAEGLHS